VSGPIATTVLFTDLVGSTDLASRLGPSATEELRLAHFALLRGAISATGGTEVKNLGDGLMVAFSSPSRAVACGVAMQQAIERHNRREPTQLHVRIGIATGECNEDGGDYFGEPVVEAARLCGVCEGGHILVTDLVRMLIGRHAVNSFTTRGRMELKGLPAPVEVAEVVWESEVEESSSTVAMPSRLVTAATSGVFGFFGRVAEMGVLRDALKEAEANALRVVLISGEPGIGKTTLVGQLAREAHDRGAAVLFGHCAEDLGVAYQPWIEVLEYWIEHGPSEIVDPQVAANGAVLGRVLPKVGRRMEVPTGFDAETERYLFLQHASELLASAGDERPVVVVLDDLHWIDTASCQLLRHLLTSGVSKSMLILATYRDTDLSKGNSLTAFLADMRREPAVQRVGLSGLGDDEVLALCEAAAGHELDEEGVALAHALRHETSGNPYFTAELIRHLAESGDIYQGTDGRWTTSREVQTIGLPTSVREVIGRRVERLGEHAHHVLTLAAVIGREFDLDLLAVVTEMSEDALLDLLEEAINAALIKEDVDVPGRFAFAQALVQHTLMVELSATRQQRAHHRIAVALEDICGEDREPRLEELAYHWAAATRSIDQGKAVDYARRAGDAALAALAPDQAAKWFAQALEIFGNQLAPDAALGCDLHMALGHALWQAGNPPDACREFSEATDRARRLNDGPRLARAALGYTGAGYRPFARETGQVDEASVSLLREATEALGEDAPELRVRLLGALAQELYYSIDAYDERDELSGHALQIARSLDDSSTLAYTLGTRHAALRRPSNVQERLLLVGEMIAASEAAGLRDASLHAHRYRLSDLVELGDVAGADAEASILEAATDRQKLPFFEWTTTAYRGMRAMMFGRFDECERLITEAFSIGERSAATSAATDFGVQFACLRYLQGRDEELIDAVRGFIEESPRLVAWKAALALVLVDCGFVDDARKQFHTVSEAGFADLPDDLAFLLGLAMASEVCWQLGDADRAPRLKELLEPYARHAVTVSHLVYFGPVSYYLGLLEMTGSDLVTAHAHLDRAIDTCTRLGAEPWLALAEAAKANALRRDGDERAAEQLLTAASSLAERLGMQHLAGRIQSQTAS
jgi:class 3 adenylate cyclase